ncbi:MAG: hypothetical protein V1725_01340 [archaeon]
MNAPEHDWIHTFEQLSRTTRQLSSDLPYHNAEHAFDVCTEVLSLSKNLPWNERYLLGTAALLHDIEYKVGYAQNEEHAVGFAERYLPHLGYVPQEIQRISEHILSTKLGSPLKNEYSAYLVDADLANLGRTDFFEKNELLRKEWCGKDGKEWQERALAFLSQHTYRTKEAQEQYDEQKRKNIECMLEKVKVYAS